MIISWLEWLFKYAIKFFHIMKEPVYIPDVD